MNADDGAILARALVATRLTPTPADQAASDTLLSHVLSEPHALDVMTFALLHATDWAAALLVRHATVTGTPANTLFQGISLQLNLTDDDPRPVPDSDPDDR